MAEYEKKVLLFCPFLRFLPVPSSGLTDLRMEKGITFIVLARSRTQIVYMASEPDDPYTRAL